MEYVFSMEQMQKDGLSTEEAFSVLDKIDLSNTWLCYADGACTREILVKKSNGTKIEGIELGSSSHYSNATCPEPIFSLLRSVKVDLKEADIFPDSIIARRAKEDDLRFVEEQRAIQQSFLKDMVILPECSSNYYQEISVSPNEEWTNYYNIQLLNISGVHERIPYVMRQNLVISKVTQFDEVVSTYYSCEGKFLPDTRMRFKLPDGEIFYHYKEVKENSELVIDKLVGDYKIFVTALLETFEKYEYTEE